MKEAFDDLSKALASGMSRREALKRFGIAAAGAVFFLRPGGALGGTDPGRNNRCKEFCRFMYGDTKAGSKCWQDSLHGKGACYDTGPKSEGCKHVECPERSYCVSHTFNFNFTGSGANGHCVPY